VTVPLSLPGIVAGSLLCFIPITGEFVIPDLLGSSSTAMIGQTLWLEFFGNRDWPVASALAIVLLVILLTPILIYRQRESGSLGAMPGKVGTGFPSGIATQDEAAMPGKVGTGFPSGIATQDEAAMPGKVGTGFPSGIATNREQRA
jgi:hypothetical protein